MFRTMDQFRSTAILQFAVTCMDIIALPFYLVGLVQPTRFDLSFRAVYIGLTVKGDEPNEPSYEARVILCRNCFAGLFEIVGVACFLASLVMPWPTAIIRLTERWYSRYLVKLSSREHCYHISQNDCREHFQYCAACTSIKVFVRSVCEIALFPLCLVGVFVPTRTMPTLRFIGNVFYYRMWMTWEKDQTIPQILSKENVWSRCFGPAMVLWSLISFVDILTAGPLLFCVLFGWMRLPHMWRQGMINIERDLGSSPSVGLWPWRTNMVQAPTGINVEDPWLPNGNMNDWPFVGGDGRKLYTGIHWSSSLRGMIWKQAMFCLLDLLLLPFFGLALFGMVHTIPFIMDLKKHWKKPSVVVPLASGITNVTAFPDVPDPSSLSSAGIKDSAADSAVALGDLNHPLEPAPWNDIETERYDAFMEIWGYNWLIRVDMLYHAVMTVVDILFVPPLLICCIFCCRSKEVVLALRQGFNNKTRQAILFAVWLVFTDLVLLPPLLLTLTYGLIFRRARPLYRELCHRATASSAEQQQHTPVDVSEGEVPPFSLEIDREERGSGSSAAIALAIRMETSEWHQLILRQFFLVIADTIVLPCTVLVFVTRWRWHSMVTNTRAITSEGQIIERIQKRRRRTVIEINRDNQLMDRDSRCVYHCWVLMSALLVVHDIILVVGVGAIVCCTGYRFRRYVAIMSHAASLWKTIPKNVDFSFDHDYVGRCLVWRWYLWKQFFLFVGVDVIGWVLGVATCIVAPHRTPQVWRVLKKAYLNRTSPWFPPPVYVDVDSTAGDNNAVAVTVNVQEEKKRDNIDREEGIVGTQARRRQVDVRYYDKETLSPLMWPKWNGEHNNDEFRDGFWIADIFKAFWNGLVDVPFIIAALPVILTVYRLDKLILPMYYNRDMSIWEKRVLPLKQMFMVVADMAALPLFAVVFGTLYRCYPAVSECCSKRTKPCLDDNSAVLVRRARLDVTGKPGVGRTVLNFVFRVESRDLNDPNSNIDQHHSPHLRIMGMSSLWESIKKSLGELTSSLAQSAMPYRLRVGTGGSDQASELTWVKVNETQWDVRLRLELGMKRTTIYKKMKIVADQRTNNNFVMMNLQIETISKVTKQRMVCFSLVTPLQIVVDAANVQDQEEEEDQSIQLGETTEDQITPTWWNESCQVNPHLGDVADYAAMQASATLQRERGTKRDYSDMRDNFAMIMVKHFVKICIDLIHLAISLLVLTLCPWRFFALVFTLCEPKRRFPIRISSKIMGKLYNTCDLNEDSAYDSLVLQANEFSKASVPLKKIEPLADKRMRHFLKAPWSNGTQSKSAAHKLSAAEKMLSRHEKIVNSCFKNLNKLTPPPPFMSELRNFVKLRDQRLHHVGLHMYLNRARICRLFPPNTGDQREKMSEYQEHESLPRLFEIHRSAQNEHELKTKDARNLLVEAQKKYEKEGLKSVPCKKWGCWHKSGALSRTLSRYMLLAGVRDWCYILLRILLVVTLYKIPSIFRDFKTVPRMTEFQAWRTFFSPSGSSRIFRIIRKHVWGLGNDIRLVLYNLFLCLAVLILLVRFPKYIAYVPLASSLDDLAKYGKLCIHESFSAFWEFFLLITACNSIVVALRAVFFALLMPAAGLAELMFSLCPGCSEAARFIFGVLMWVSLFGLPIIVVFAVEKEFVLLSFGYYSIGLFVLFLLCWSASCCSTPKGRIVNRYRWSAPSLRLDSFPNLFALITIPAETIILVILCLFIYSGHESSSSTSTSTSTSTSSSNNSSSNSSSSAFRWPSIDEDSPSGWIMRQMNVIMILFAFLWIFVTSVPLAINDETKRKEVQRSSFYLNTAGFLQGILFLPIIVGLILPWNCGNGPASSYHNNTEVTFNMSSLVVDQPSYVTDYVCWEGSHRINIILSAELLLVVMLTNIAAIVDKTTDKSGVPNDIGLDIVWSNLFTSSTKLIQVVIVLACVASISKNQVAQFTCFVASILLALWIPSYWIIVRCCCFPKNERLASQMVVSSVPWMSLLRAFGFLAVASTSILLFAADNNFSSSFTAAEYSNDDVAAWISLVIFLVGLLVAALVRFYHKEIRKRHLASTGLTKAMDQLVKLEDELFARGAFDTQWSLQAKKNTKERSITSNTLRSYQDASARKLWKSRVRRMTSARQLASALENFEHHVLCENLHPKFLNERNGWLASLRDLSKFALRLESQNENVAVQMLVERLHSHLRSPPKMEILVHLIRQRMRKLHFVPVRAVRCIMNYLSSSSTTFLFDGFNIKLNQSNIVGFNPDDFNEAPKYLFPLDVGSTWTTGLYDHLRGEKKKSEIIRENVNHRRRGEVVVDSRHPVGSDSWFSTRYSCENIWRVKAKYAQLMVCRVIYGICKVEAVREAQLEERLALSENEMLEHELASVQNEKKEKKDVTQAETKTETKTTSSTATSSTATSSMMWSAAKFVGSNLLTSVTNVTNAAVGKWQCQQCTFSNDALHLQCKMCGAQTSGFSKSDTQTTGSSKLCSLGPRQQHWHDLTSFSMDSRIHARTYGNSSFSMNSVMNARWVDELVQKRK